MNSSMSGVVKSISRYAFRLASVLSTPIESNRFVQVGVLSSAAKIPRPFSTMAFAISGKLFQLIFSPFGF